MIVRRISTIVSGVAVAIVVAVLSMGLASQVLERDLDTELIAGTDFFITSSITAHPACSGGPAFLVPGTTRCLTYAVSNPLPDPITVSSITIELDPSWALPPGCPASNLDLTGAGFSGSLVVPAKVGANNGVATVTRTIALLNTASDQGACQNQEFHFRYTGTATYTHVYATATALTASPNPVLIGSPVTYSATVTTPGGTPPSPPTGTVVFNDGAAPITCGAGSVAFNGSTATCKVTYATTVGSPHSITAVYTPGPDGNFTGSTSAPVSQVVSAPTTSSLVSSGNPSVKNQSVSFTVTVASTVSGTPTGTATFFDGTTSLGTRTLSAGKATLTTSSLSVGTHAIKAVYNGAPTFDPSTSNTISQVVYTRCITGTQLLGLTVKSGESICITASGQVFVFVLVRSGGALHINGGAVHGKVTVEPGGSLFMTGGRVDLNITAVQAAAVRICGAQYLGFGVSISDTASRVVFGDGTTACPGSSLNNGVTLSKNLKGLVLGGNKLQGTIAVKDNKGFGTGLGSKIEIDGNQISGRLECSGNVPAPTNNGHPNTVSGTRTGQTCSASGF